MNYIRIMFAYTPAIASSWIDTTHAHYSVVTICWMTALKKFKFFAWNFQSLSFRMQIMRSCEPRGQMQIGYTNIAINRRVFWQGALFRRQNIHFFCLSHVCLSRNHQRIRAKKPILAAGKRNHVMGKGYVQLLVAACWLTYKETNHLPAAKFQDFLRSDF